MSSLLFFVVGRFVERSFILPLAMIGLAKMIKGTEEKQQNGVVDTKKRIPFFLFCSFCKGDLVTDTL